MNDLHEFAESISKLTRANMQTSIEALSLARSLREELAELISKIENVDKQTVKDRINDRGTELSKKVARDFQEIADL